MTLRPEEISRPCSDKGARYAWHLRFKGVRGQGIYGSVVTDRQGRGLYLLAFGDFPGDFGYEQRMTCILSSQDFCVSPEAHPLEAREAITSALLSLGWGPRV